MGNIKTTGLIFKVTGVTDFTTMCLACQLGTLLPGTTYRTEGVSPMSNSAPAVALNIVPVHNGDGLRARFQA